MGDITFSKNDSYNTHSEVYIYPSFFDTYSTEDFFYNINKNKTVAHISDMGDNSMFVYISGDELKRIHLDIAGKEVTRAYITTYNIDSDGELYTVEEFTFRAAKPSYDEFGYDV